MICLTFRLHGVCLLPPFPQPDVHAAIQSADMVINTSKSEGTPQAVLEVRIRNTLRLTDRQTDGQTTVTVILLMECSSGNAIEDSGVGEKYSRQCRCCDRL